MTIKNVLNVIHTRSCKVMENVSQTAAKDVEIISVYPIMFVMLVRLIMDMDLTVQNADIVSHLTVDSVH